MFFKKKKITPQSHKTYKTPFLLGGIGVLGIFLMGVFVVGAMNNLNFRVFDFANSSGTPINMTREIVGEEKENTDIRYILLTGKGGGSHDAPDLTDTLILLGLNSEKQTISMLSVPRDLYVEYPGTDDEGKINEIYFHGLQRGKETAMNELMGKVTEITGKKIDYYVNLDFQGFIEIVNVLGGVEVSLEENFVDSSYPDGNLGYKTFILKKGTWTLDGEVALMYARSRYSTSDFDRSLRQQEIISSLKEKVSELGYFKDRKKIIELYEIVSEYIDTNMSLKEIIAVALDLKSWENTQTLSFNLNDSCFYEEADCGTGGFLYTPLRQYFDGKSVIIPNGATYYDLNVYNEIHDFSKLVFNTPEVFATPTNIAIYNASGTPGLASEYSNILKPYGLIQENNILLSNLTEKKFEKSILYYNGVLDNDITLSIIEKALDIKSEKTDFPLFSGSGTQIEIILVDESKETSSGSLIDTSPQFEANTSRF